MIKNGCAQDFDFQIGDWHVRHRRLNGRLVGSTDWQEFDGTCSMRTIMAGQGNIEDNQIHIPGGSYRAVALRSFDPITCNWAIWWLDARNPHGLDVPVVGSFKGGVGTFYADDRLDSKPIRVRFTWRTSGDDTPSWEQAFSPDGGANWEVNWKMQFSRLTDQQLAD